MFLIQTKRNNQITHILTQLFPFLCLVAIVHPNLTSAKLPLPNKWEVTQVKSDNLRYLWTLADISSHRESDTCVKSKTFSSEKSSQEWMLTLCFSTIGDNFGETLGNDLTKNETHEWQNIRISLYYLSQDPQFIEGNYTLTLMDGALCEIRTFKGVVGFGKRTDMVLHGQEELNYLYQVLIEDKNRVSLINDDKLIISVEMPLKYDFTHSFSGYECGVITSKDRAEIRSKYEDIYERYKSSYSEDAKNWVLGTKSGENITVTAYIIDKWGYPMGRYYDRLSFEEFDLEVANETINFFYHGEAPRMKTMAKELFKVAQKFQFGDLKKLAEEEICSNLILDTDDLIENLIFASELNADRVKYRIINYIFTQPKYFLELPQFGQLEKTHSNLMREILSERARQYIDY